MRPTASLRWRAAAAGLLLIVVLLYHRQNSQTRAALHALQTALGACEQNGESVVAKLKVVHQHKVKIDELYRRSVNESRRAAEESAANLRRCELNHLAVKERLTTCESRQSGNTVSQNTVEGKKEAEGEEAGGAEGRAGREGRQVPQPIGAEHQRVDELLRRAAELERWLNETRTQLKAEQKERALLKKRLEECEQQMVAHVGAAPKSGYSVNETANFERVHDKDANLEFHRDGDAAFQPAPIMPARELVKRLEEKRRAGGGGKRGKEGEEEDGGEAKHPQDREENDEYVAEKPNAAEEDYKEQERQ